MRVLLILLAIVVVGCSAENPPADSQAGELPDPAAAASNVDLSPRAWPKEELQAYLKLVAGTPLSESLPSMAVQTNGRTGMVASTITGFGVHAGLQALKQGGSAVDAALTTALTQVALHMGGATSYAGHLGMLYFEAETGEVHRLNASYGTLLEEDDPMSIPEYGTPSGRAVLVPGFMAGVEAAHRRFGRLPFAKLFEPAIFLAEEGFELSAFWARFVEQREHVLMRRAEGRALFLKENGELLQAGDTVRQTELAGFLRRVAAQGASYMYEGPWAAKLIDVVREEGGKMTLEDLGQYEVAWSKPAPVDFRGYQVYAGTGLQEKLRLVELANLRSMGHYTESPDALYWLIKISRVGTVLSSDYGDEGVPSEQVTALLSGLDLSGDGRHTPQTAAKIWATMQTPAWAELEELAEREQLKRAEAIARLIKDFRIRPKDDKAENAQEGEDGRPSHTSGIVVVDAAGNMVAMSHSVTSAVWGEVGIFVEGVSVTDPAAFAQSGVAAAGPGKLLRAGGGGNACPAIAVKESHPYLGCSNVGAGYDLVALQGLVNMLEYGIKTEDVQEPPMFRKNWPPGQPLRQPVGEGEFSKELIIAVKAMGIDIEPVDDPQQGSQGGGWIVGTIDDEGVLSGMKTSGRSNKNILTDSGVVEAY